MPKVIQPLPQVGGDACSQCQCRFKWHQSKSGKCYWCETGRMEKVLTSVPLVEPPVASFKPSKAKRR